MGVLPIIRAVRPRRPQVYGSPPASGSPPVTTRRPIVVVQPAVARVQRPLGRATVLKAPRWQKRRYSPVVAVVGRGPVWPTTLGRVLPLVRRRVVTRTPIRVVTPTATFRRPPGWARVLESPRRSQGSSRTPTRAIVVNPLRELQSGSAAVLRPPRPLYVPPVVTRPAFRAILASFVPPKLRGMTWVGRAAYQVSTVTTYPNLPYGIVTRALADPVLSSLLRGGISFGTAERGTPDPYASFHEISAIDNYTTGRGYWQQKTYQVDLYADSDEALEEIREAWVDVFNFRKLQANPILFVRGKCFRIDSMIGPKDDDHGLNPMGVPLRRQIIEIVCWQSRKFPS